MNRRRAFTLIELTASCLVLAGLLTVCLQLVQATQAARRASSQRQVALEEASNALERIAALEFGELTVARAESLLPAEAIARRLPGGRVAVVVDPSADAWGAKRVAVTVAWRSFSEEPEKTVHLVAWKYPLPKRRGGEEAGS